MRCAQSLAVQSDAVASLTCTVHRVLVELKPLHILSLLKSTPCANRYEQHNAQHRLYAVILDSFSNPMPTRAQASFKSYQQLICMGQRHIKCPLMIILLRFVAHSQVFESWLTHDRTSQHT